MCSLLANPDRAFTCVPFAESRARNGWLWYLNVHPASDKPVTHLQLDNLLQTMLTPLPFLMACQYLHFHFFKHLSYA